MAKDLLNRLQEEAKPVSPFKAATPRELKKRKEEAPIFKCPKCGDEIEKVDTVSKKYGQDAIDAGGNVGGGFDDFGGQTDVIEVYCTSCGEEITKEVNY